MIIIFGFGGLSTFLGLAKSMGVVGRWRPGVFGGDS